MFDHSLKTQAFKLKGRFYTFTVLHLLDVNLAHFEDYLKEVVQTAPKLFEHTPVVIDCSALEEETFALQDFCQCMRRHGMLPIGIQGGNAFLQMLAQTEGLATLHASANHDRPLEVMHESITPPVSEAARTKLVEMPVRSGQQVVNPEGDLIVIAPVSHGAELLAHGHIHVYGPLRGRALAGISGDKHTRIFCQSLDAELVAIAGYYRLRESIEPIPEPCQIYLQDDHIHIEVITHK